MTVSLRLSEEDSKLIKSYAALNGITVSEAFRRAMLEKIEDEYDLKLFEEAKKEFEKDPVTYSHEEVKKMLGL